MGGTIRLETFNQDLSELKTEQREYNKEVISKLDIISRSQDNHQWRIENMEKQIERIQANKNGGNKGAI